jgi:hypothetical protein
MIPGPAFLGGVRVGNPLAPRRVDGWAGRNSSMPMIAVAFFLGKSFGPMVYISEQRTTFFFVSVNRGPAPVFGRKNIGGGRLN